MATIRKLPSGRFNVQIRRKNAHPISRTFDAMEDAQQWATEHELAGRAALKAGEGLTFLELGQRYCDTVLKGRPSRDIALNRVERIARNLPRQLTDISRQDVNAYRQIRLRAVSTTTCRDELVFIHRLYRWAHREMILDKAHHPSPCEDVYIPPSNKPRTKVIERSELDRLLANLPKTMRPIIELAYETAMRRSEIVRLTARHVHLSERVASVVEGKTGDRDVPLTQRAVELLREALARVKHPDAPLFPVVPHSVTTAVRRARQKAGLSPDIRLHQLRHTRITNVAKKGLNQAQIMMVSGHRDVRSVQRYTHLRVKDVVGLID
ncbi:site-specific integrase [Marivibrio halodurans]|uniref:Site-specific integrase n=1 Tax=Marivibrio halodurans TaxID=2039722 RepID=A0A8J7SJT5_9PROT|nr:site-specific integrase [Marivibrio halodurans]MBP5857978.1 site-specific integrase [Marivibrio halodurans]